MLKLCVLIPAAATVVHAQNAALATRVDEYLAPYLAMHDFSGSVLISRGGVVLVRKGYGMADKELGVPNRPDMAYAVGSITKTVTAAAVALLAQDGRLRLSDPVERYLPDFRPGDTISIASILAHSARIPDYYAFPEFAARRRDAISPAEFVGLIASKPLDQQAAYSNSGYAVLAALVARVAGVPFDDFVRARLLVPLGMSRSGMARDAQVIPGLAPGYDAGFDPAGVQPAARDSWSWLFGNGSMYSTVDDLRRWLEALRTDSVVRWSALEYPFGWGKRTHFGRSAIEQDGRIPKGYTSYVALYPKDGLEIVVLSNIQVDVAGRIGVDLAGLVFGEHVEPPPVRRASVQGAGRASGADYVGTYFISPDFAVFVDTAAGGLQLAGPDRAFLPLQPVGADSFFFRTLYVPIRFDRDEHGRVSALHWGDSFVAKRGR